MITIFLPGYSIKNKKEQSNIAKALEENNFKVYQHQWRHWENPDISWDPNVEVERILEFINSTNETEFSLIGKSIGTFVSTKLLSQFPKDLKILILMGIPVNDLDPEEIKQYDVLDSTNIPLYVIQNNKDPHGNVDQTKDILEDSNYKELIMEADTHEYEYIEDILEIYKENFL